MKHLIVGIDPGTTTGFAVWWPAKKLLTRVESMQIHKAMREVERLHAAELVLKVVYEDARLRNWFGAKGSEALQGAGSIKRDCAIWGEFLGDLGVPYHQIKPVAGSTKWDATLFAKLTGWPGRTNEHARDAALLVWGMK